MDSDPRNRLAARLVASARLSERDDELHQAGAMVDAAAVASGRLLAIEGPAGIGKTSLLRAIAEMARHAGMLVLTAQGTELERDFAFGIAHQLLDPTLLRADRRARDDLFDGAARFAAPLFELGDMRGVSQAGNATLHGLYWLCANLALQRPLVMLVDDAHWADESSQRFLEFLAPRLEGMPILLVLAIRSPAIGRGSAATRLLIDHAATVLRPCPLGAAGAAALLGHRLEAAPDSAFTAACLRATGGNPFLLEELAISVQQAQIVPNAASAASIAQLGPAAIAQRVGAALQRLGHDACALADALAILGDGTQIGHAAKLAGLERDAASAAADALASAGLLEGTRPLRFLHPVLGAAVRERMPAGARALAHSRAADLLAAAGESRDRVAAHLLATDPIGDRARTALLQAAASDSTARGAPEAAVAYLRRALAENASSDAQRASLLHALGRAEHASGQTCAVATLEAAQQAAPDPIAGAHVALDLAFAFVPDQAERAITLLAGARDAVNALDSELADRLEAERLLVWVAVPRLGPLISARADAVARQPSRTLLSEPERLMLAALARDRHEHGERAAEAEALIERALDGPTADGFLSGVGLLTAMMVLLNVDRDDLAHALLGAAITAAQRRGSAPDFAIASVWRGMVALRCGNVATAEADARAALDVTFDHAWHRAPALAVLVDAIALRGAGDEADQLLASHAMTGTLPSTRAATTLLAARGRLHHTMGRRTQARDDLIEVEARLGGPDSVNAHGLETRVALVRLLLELGESEQAERRAASAVLAGRARGLPRTEGLGLLAAALIAVRGSDVPLIERACARLAESPARLDHVRALLDLGGALRRANRRADARTPLRLARSQALLCGANVLADEARRELTVTGVRVPRIVATGVAALTPSERRIAGMAADGMSNPAIAQALFVTVKTVEMHLGNTFRKLDVRSRHDLATALTEAAPTRATG